MVIANKNLKCFMIKKGAGYYRTCALKKGVRVLKGHNKGVGGVTDEGVYTHQVRASDKKKELNKVVKIVRANLDKPKKLKVIKPKKPKKLKVIKAEKPKKPRKLKVMNLESRVKKLEDAIRRPAMTSTDASGKKTQLYFKK
tara:strand:+ start:127 stop:549 length:423 start_codon:yes stop_codon:yes gene_type:complete